MTVILDRLPLGVVFLGFLLLVILAVEFGYLVGKRRRQASETEKESAVGAILGASLGLVALVVAFTFQIAAHRFDQRRQLVLEESNVIGTAYLRTSFLPEVHQKKMRSLLREYLSLRLDAVHNNRVEDVLVKNQKLQSEIWSETVAVVKMLPNSVSISLFTQSINDLIDMHSLRYFIGAKSRIPPSIWYVLFFVAFSSLAMIGYQEGVVRSRRSLVSFVMAVSFSLALWLIADLDRPQQGILKVSQEPLENALQMMGVE